MPLFERDLYAGSRPKWTERRYFICYLIVLVSAPINAAASAADNADWLPVIQLVTAILAGFGTLRSLPPGTRVIAHLTLRNPKAQLAYAFLKAAFIITSVTLLFALASDLLFHTPGESFLTPGAAFALLLIIPLWLQLKHTRSRESPPQNT